MGNIAGIFVGKVLMVSNRSKNAEKYCGTILAGNSCRKILWENLVGSPLLAGKSLWETILQENLVEENLSWEILVGKSYVEIGCGTIGLQEMHLLWENVAGNSWGTMLQEILAR